MGLHQGTSVGVTSGCSATARGFSPDFEAQILRNLSGIYMVLLSMFKLCCIIANLREGDISLSYYIFTYILYSRIGCRDLHLNYLAASRMQRHNFKSLPATLITGSALGEFVKSGPRKKFKRRGATLITSATLNTGFTVYLICYMHDDYMMIT